MTLTRFGTGIFLSLTIPSALSAQEIRRPAAGVQVGGPTGLLPEARFKILFERRARLGISINMRAVDSDSIGALIQAVTPNGPAARAGIRTGDVITRINGRTLAIAGVGQSDDGASVPGLRLTEIASLLEPGDSVTLEYRRGQDRKTVLLLAGDEPGYAWTGPDGGVLGYPEDQLRTMVYQMTPPPPGARPMEGMGFDSFSVRIDSGDRVTTTLRTRSDADRRFERSRLPPPMIFVRGSPLADLELAPVNRNLGRYFGTSTGILVIDVPEGSKLGLEPGDVVLKIDGRPPASPGHLLRILGTYDAGEPVHLEVMRFRKRLTITGQTADR